MSRTYDFKFADMRQINITTMPYEESPIDKCFDIIFQGNRHKLIEFPNKVCRKFCGNQEVFYRFNDNNENNTLYHFGTVEKDCIERRWTITEKDIKEIFGLDLMRVYFRYDCLVVAYMKPKDVAKFLPKGYSIVYITPQIASNIKKAGWYILDEADSTHEAFRTQLAIKS